jgi:hypothetical protein
MVSGTLDCLLPSFRSLRDMIQLTDEQILSLMSQVLGFYLHISLDLTGPGLDLRHCILHGCGSPVTQFQRSVPEFGAGLLARLWSKEQHRYSAHHGANDHPDKNGYCIARLSFLYKFLIFGIHIIPSFWAVVNEPPALALDLLPEGKDTGPGFPWRQAD